MTSWSIASTRRMPAAPEPRAGRAPETALACAGKVAMVTGAGSGIGRAVAEALIAAGADVAALGRRREALTETLRLAADAAGKPAGRALALPTDISDRQAVERAVRQVEEAWGRIDL